MSVSSRVYFTTFFVSTAVVNLSSLMPRIFDVPTKSSFGLLFGRSVSLGVSDCCYLAWPSCISASSVDDICYFKLSTSS
jgi:hypothetical protein